MQFFYTVRPELIQQANNLPSSQILPGMRPVIPYALPGGPNGCLFKAPK